MGLFGLGVGKEKAYLLIVLNIPSGPPTGTLVISSFYIIRISRSSSYNWFVRLLGIEQNPKLARLDE